MNGRDVIAVGSGIALFIHLGFIVYKAFSERLTSSNRNCNQCSQTSQTCKVCKSALVDVESCTLLCNHKFHKKCLQKIFKNSANRRICPVCKQPIKQLEMDL